MPELPDLVHVEATLRGRVVGRQIADARTGDPTVLRLMLRDPFPQRLVGRTVTAVERRGHFVIFSFDDDLRLVVNPMLTGRFALVEPGGRDPAALALALVLGDDLELRYLDETRMGKVYVLLERDLGKVPQLATLGVELLSPAFTREHFRPLVARRRDQVRQFLMDKRAIAAIGNAYADEILFEARLHPKTFCPKLAPEEIDRLYDAIGAVMTRAIAEVARRGEPIEVKVRDFLAVRGREGKPCPRCGTVIRSVRVGDGDACFCPGCQPASRALFVDWGKLPARRR